MKPDPRGRVVLPVVIPIVALLVTAFVVYAISRILLAVPKTSATLIAIAMALNVLVGCTLVVLFPRLRSSVLVAGLVIVGLGLAGGGAVAIAVSGDWLSSGREVAHQAEHPERAESMPPEPGDTPPAVESPTGGGLTVVAQNIAFDVPEIALPAGEEAAITFDNRDAGTSHNIAIYTEREGDVLFQGEIFTGPDTIEYRVPPIDAGEYHFQCDVHPTMSGIVTVA